MRFEFKPSFDRSLKSLPHEEKEEIKVVFRWDRDLAEFVLVGNHDQIKRFLRSV